MSSDEKREGLGELDETEPSAEELRAARQLAGDVEQVLDGGRPASGDELAAAAQMIVASMRDEHLAPGRRDELVRDALDEARVGQRRSWQAASLVALAASLLLVVGAAVLVWKGAPRGPRYGTVEPPTRLLSRASNDLLGQPIVDRAGASRRLDLVFADRLGGYREARLLSGGMP